MPAAHPHACSRNGFSSSLCDSGPIFAALLSTLILFSPMTSAQIPVRMPPQTPTQTAAVHYPDAHTVDQVDSYFGTKVPDPYRWMENVDAPEVKAWVDAENELTHSILNSVP